MRRPSRPVPVMTVENAPESVLREWVRQLQAKQAATRDDARLGWWVRTNAATVTLTTPDQQTITANGANLLDAIDRYHAGERALADWRAA